MKLDKNLIFYKLDGVGTVDNRPWPTPNSSTTLLNFFREKRRRKKLHVTDDM
jgi:hypothetical protein